MVPFHLVYIHQRALIRCWKNLSTVGSSREVTGSRKREAEPHSSHLVFCAFYTLYHYLQLNILHQELKTFPQKVRGKKAPVHCLPTFCKGEPHKAWGASDQPTSRLCRQGRWEDYIKSPVYLLWGETGAEFWKYRGYWDKVNGTMRREPDKVRMRDIPQDERSGLLREVPSWGSSHRGSGVNESD